jgi:hypothetical protein
MLIIPDQSEPLISLFPQLSIGRMWYVEVVALGRIRTRLLLEHQIFVYFPCSKVFHVKCRLLPEDLVTWRPWAMFQLHHVRELNFCLRIAFGLLFFVEHSMHPGVSH